jgi:hypothetical protein
MRTFVGSEQRAETSVCPGSGSFRDSWAPASLSFWTCGNLKLRPAACSDDPLRPGRSVSVGIARIEHMFETAPDQSPRSGVVAVRVPFAALAARPGGREVAARAAALASALAAPRAPVSSDENPAKRDGSELAGIEPGPVLATVLDEVSLNDTSDYDLVEVISGWERIKAHAEARQFEAIAALSQRPVFAGCAEHGLGDSNHGTRGAASEISAALRLSPNAARSRAELAVELVDQLPATLAELRGGRIDGYRASVIAAQTRPLAEAPDARREVEAAALVKAHRQTAAQLRSATRKAVIAADATAAEDRHRRARAGRFLSAPCPEPDGMASMLLRLPAEDAAAFWVAIDAAARAKRAADPNDKRTLDQLRADVLASVGWSALEAGHLGCCNAACRHVNHRLGRRRGKAASVDVTVSVTTLLGIDNQPGHLAGYGPITAEVARRIAANGTWRRILTDPASGAVLDVGRQRYTPPADLAEHVIVRDRTCRFPTCTRPAAGCDVDHTVPYEQGGPTSDGNLDPLHRSHHNDKTHDGWWLEQPEPGTFVWTSPTGHTYEVEPEIVGLLAQPPPPVSTDPVDLDPPPF